MYKAIYTKRINKGFNITNSIMIVSNLKGYFILFLFYLLSYSYTHKKENIYLQ